MGEIGSRPARPIGPRGANRAIADSEPVLAGEGTVKLIERPPKLAAPS